MQRNEREIANSTSGSDENQYYTVEAILDKQLYKRKWCYEVKWEGFPDNTWEPVKNFEHLNIAKQFEKELKKKRKAATTSAPKQEKPSSYHFDKEVADEVQAQLMQLGPITGDKISRLIGRGTRVKSILGMEMTSTDCFVSYEDGSNERVSQYLLQIFEGKKLTDFLASQVWDLNNR